VRLSSGLPLAPSFASEQSQRVAGSDLLELTHSLRRLQNHWDVKIDSASVRESLKTVMTQEVNTGILVKVRALVPLGRALPSRVTLRRRRWRRR